MRAGIIGTGYVASIHAQVLRELGHEISAVVNPDKKQATLFAQQWGVKAAYHDLETALAKGIDTAHICTPPVSHAETITACLNAGVHIFSEKPLSIDPHQAYQIALLANQKKLVNAVNFNNRFYEVSKLARDIITSPEFGAPHLIHGRYLQEYHVLPDQYGWRYQPEFGGPMRAVTEIGSHWLDLARYWTGLEITAVSAMFGNFQPKRVLTEGMMMLPESDGDVIITSEDAAAISLQFSNGAMGSVLLSEVSHGRSNQLRLEVTGSTDSLWWDSEKPYQLHQAQKNTGVQSKTYPFGLGFTGTFHDAIAAFYVDVEQGLINPHHPYADFMDGAINAAICAAIYESSQKASQWVAVQTPTT